MRLRFDASAALGIIEPRGVGCVRHVEVGSLWIPEQQLKRIAGMLKVPRLEKPADLSSKHLTRESIHAYIHPIRHFFESGRPTTIPVLHMLHRVDGQISHATPHIGSLPFRMFGCRQVGLSQGSSRKLFSPLQGLLQSVSRAHIRSE